MSALLGAVKGIGARARGVVGRARGLRRKGMRRRHRRGRGVSAAGIRGARKLLNLLRDFQTALPRGRAHVAPRRRRNVFRPRGRRGDPEDFSDEWE